MNLSSLLKDKLYQDNLNTMNTREAFELQLNINLNVYDPIKVNTSLGNLNYLFMKINSDQLDDVYSKYLNKLTDIFKETIGKFKTKSNSYHPNDFVQAMINVNFNFVNFIRSFSRNYQKYNDKHKNVLKLLPNFLKLYFKLTEENLDYILSNEKLLESVLFNWISCINYYPTLMRPYGNRIEVMLRNIFSSFLQSENIHRENLKISTMTHCLLVRLSPDQNTKFDSILDRTIKNLNYFLDIYSPKDLKSAQAHKETLPVNVSIFDEKVINNKLFNQAYIVFEIIFKMLKYLFKTIQPKQKLVLNLKNLVEVLLKLINKSTEKKIDFIVEGLSNQEYTLIKEILYNRSIKLMSLLFKDYGTSFYFYLPRIRQVTSSMVINEREYKKVLDSYRSTLNFFDVLINTYSSLLFSSIEDVIYKLMINNFIDIYITFLERNDQTVVKLSNNTYTKISKNKSISLIQRAKMEDSSQNLYNAYSNIEIELILIGHLKVLTSYIKSECFNPLLKNEDNRQLLYSLVDLVILPSYAKFIFHLSAKVKESIIEFVQAYVENCHSSHLIPKHRIVGFVKSFYANDTSLCGRLERIFQSIFAHNTQVSDSYRSDMTQHFIEFNKKIANKLKSNYDSFVYEIENKITSSSNNHEELNLNEDISIRQYNKTPETTGANVTTTNQEITIKSNPSSDQLINKKWNKTRNENEFVSNDNIHLFLKDPKSFTESRDKTEVRSNKDEDNKQSFRIIRTDTNLNTDDIDIPDIV